MSLQEQLNKLVAEIGIPGVRVSVGIPVPPQKPFLRDEELVDGFVVACGELHRTGTICAKYSDWIVETAPDKITVELIKPYIGRLTEISQQALESLQHHQGEGPDVERELWSPAIVAVERLMNLLKIASEVPRGRGNQVKTVELMEIFFGFDDDAEIVRDAFYQGGLPEAFETIVRLGLEREYELVVHNDELCFADGTDGLIPIQFADHDLVSERVSELKAKARSAAPAPEPAGV